MLKLSQQTPHINQVIQTICQEVFQDERVYVIDWTLPHLYDYLYELKVDLVFFTGSARIGKQVYQHFSAQLIPVILELGGKSPVIVDGSFDLALSAKRIIWGKLLNYGQTCVAPDYVLVHQSCSVALIEHLKQAVLVQANSITGPSNLAYMINQKQCDRLTSLTQGLDQQVIFSHPIHPHQPPFQIIQVQPDQCDLPLMTNEIFGPVLPIIVYQTASQLQTILDQNPYPLATYVFSTNQALINHLVVHWKTGGMVVNGTIMHLTKHTPFGGIKNSGVGQYHQAASYTAFSHLKPVVKLGQIDPQFLYPPHPEHDYQTAKRLMFKFRKYK